MHRSTRRTVVLVAAYFVACTPSPGVPAPASPARRLSREQLERAAIGCYSVRIGLFRYPDALGASFRRPHIGGEHTKPPYIVALDSGGELGPAPRVPRTIHRLNYWELDSLSDSLRLVFSTGFSGVRLTLASAGDSLTGHADDFFDYTHLSERAAALLRRVSCDSSGNDGP